MRRDCFGHVIELSASYCRRLAKLYSADYNGVRTRVSSEKRRSGLSSSPNRGNRVTSVHDRTSVEYMRSATAALSRTKKQGTV